MNFTKQLLIVMALLLAAPAAMAQRYVTDSCLVNGLMRRYKVYLPAGIKPGAPLVVCMHGYGSWAKPSRYDLDPVADREGFAVCYPCGVRDTTGKWGWNVKYPSQAALRNNEVDDVVAITQHVQRQFNLSTVNTFATGMSTAVTCAMRLPIAAPWCSVLTGRWPARHRSGSTMVPRLHARYRFSKYTVLPTR